MNLINKRPRPRTGMGNLFTDLRNSAENYILNAAGVNVSTTAAPPPPAVAVQSASSSSMFGVSLPIIAAVGILGLLAVKMLKK